MGKVYCKKVMSIGSQAHDRAGDEKGYSVSTFNHASGEERMDLQQSWKSKEGARVAWLTAPPRCKWPANLKYHQISALRDLQPSDAGKH